jgi:tetratricopeptide (TPR) repeat protein
MVIEIGKTEARRNLLAGKFAYAVPGGLQALRLTTDLHGAGGIEVVPPYLLLAQATTGLKKYKQAEEYLSLAKWSVLKHPQCSDALKSQLYRNFGKLYVSQGDPERALGNFANAVYYSALAVGPEHIDTTTGYFQMGTIFHGEGRLEAALAMFDRVADVWYKFLSSRVPRPRSGSAGGDGDGASTDEDGEDELVEPELDELAGTEAAEMLDTIIAIREQHLGITHTATGEAHYILALILKRLGKIEKALERMQRALAVYEDTLGADHATTVSVKNALEQLEQEYFNAT